MARNRPNPLDDPPAASSEEEHLHEEEVEDDGNEDEAVGVETDDDDDGKGSGSESESESSSEDEVPKKEEVKKTLPQQQQLPKPLLKNPIPDSDDETESDTETVGSPGLSGFTIHKHVVTSPDSVKTKKQVPGLLKRPPPSEGKKKDSRAKKAKVENVEREVKKSMIQVWSEDDAVALLEAILAFVEEKGADPLADGGIVFHDYVKDKLSFETSTSKLMEKIRRMKKKFVNMGEDGEDPVFPKPIDKKSWNLSKKIWGRGGVVLALQAKTLPSKRSSSKKKTKENVNGGLVVCSKGENVVSSQLPLATEKTDVKDDAVVSSHIQAGKKSDANEREFSELYPFLYLSLKNGNAHVGLISKDGLEAMEGCLSRLEKSKLEELEGEWKKQILAEAELSLGRTSILQKKIGLVSDWVLRRG